MKRQVNLAIAGMGLLFLCGGCSALILYDISQGDETPFQIPLGSTRDDVDAQLGKPVTVTPLPDGGLVAIYEHSLPVPGAGKAAELAAGLFFYTLPLPAFETIFVPYALYKAATAPQGKVTFTYGPDGRLLHLGLPPYYGPEDDAVGAPSVLAIRKSCWSHEESDLPDRPMSKGGDVKSSDRSYVQCVWLGFAIWGME